MVTRVISLKDDRFHITFDYHLALIEAVKVIPGRKYHKEGPSWSAPGSSVAYVAEFAARFHFAVTPEAREFGKTMRSMITYSSASNAELEIEGLGGTLYPYQKAGVKYALLAKRCFLVDEMGLGKTMEAIGVMQAANAYPALVVCPVSVKLKWQREIQKWLPQHTVALAESSDFPVADIVIINWDILIRHVHKHGKGYIANNEIIERGFKIVVLDESHYGKNYKAKRTKAAKAVASVAEYRLALTGTPVLSRPMEFLSQLMILDRLQDLGGFWPFVKRYCNAYKTPFGWDFKGSSNTSELNERMRATCYIRRLKSEVAKDLPAKLPRAVIPVKLTNWMEYEQAETDLVAYLQAMAFEPEEIQRKMKAESLAKIEITKQLAARGKMHDVIEWITSFLESSEKLVVFAHHRAIVKELAELFNAPRIMGNDSQKKRDVAQRKFQTDPDCKIIVCNIKAGGIGIDLFAASNVAFVELGWTPADHDQAEDRLHREGQQNIVTPWYFIAEDTVDEPIYNLIQSKRQVVKGVTEGSKVSKSASVLDELIKRLALQGLVKKSGVKRTKMQRRPTKKPRAKVQSKPFIEPKNFADREAWVKKSVLFLYARQTSDEQATDSTRNENAAGFNMIDARFGSSLARQILDGQTLSQRQVLSAEKMLRKYKRQLLEMAT